jgi:predicted nuclease with TOPRIM domain
MDPLLMVGAWAAALLSIAAAGRLLYNGMVRAVRGVVRDEMKTLWRDMQAAEDRFGEVEERLDRLEVALAELREKVDRMMELLVGHVSEMTRRHDA